MNGEALGYYWAMSHQAAKIKLVVWVVGHLITVIKKNKP